MKEWYQCKKILCVRADNMGDVIMSGPAIRALKTAFGCTITLLTSSMGSIITPFMPEIDETLVYNLPWVKSSNAIDSVGCTELVHTLCGYGFDAAIIFTVYSQNPLPTALICYMAGIPIRLAYCRENPYNLLTHWIPDKEPYTYISHQVMRDMLLVEKTGAAVSDDLLRVQVPPDAKNIAVEKLSSMGFDGCADYIIVHPGVSEDKRRYPAALWIATIQKLHAQAGMQIVITGSANEREQAVQIAEACGGYCFVACGVLSMTEFISVIASAPLVISVNTGTVHIACAVQTPVVVLYAQTNPQHTPWKTPAVVLPFNVETQLQSSNEVIRYVNSKLYRYQITYPSPESVVEAAIKILYGKLKAAG